MPKGRKKAVDEQIDSNLKRAFDALAQEPLPDRFTSLLQQLKEREDQSGPEPDEAARETPRDA
ncbi:MAG: NepR family anti-sigma factor [Pseudomonadota bacterium]